MKFIVAEQDLEVPEGVTVNVKAREVTVKGPLGTLVKAFKHIPIEIYKDKSAKTGKSILKFKMWLQRKKRNAAIGTIKSTIRNMITGVTVGYKFKMVLAYSHFPIVVNVIENGRVFQPLFRQLKSRTSWDSKQTRELMLLRVWPSQRRRKRRTTLLSTESTLSTSLRCVLVSNNQPLSRTRIWGPSSTESTSLRPDLKWTTDWIVYLNISNQQIINHLLCQLFLTFWISSTTPSFSTLPS